MDAREQRVGVFAAPSCGALAVPIAGVAEAFDAAVALPAVGDDRAARAVKDSPAYWAWNVQKVAAGTGEALLAGAAVMAMTDASATAAGATDPRHWGTSGWLADIVHHAVFGVVLGIRFDRLPER